MGEVDEAHPARKTAASERASESGRIFTRGAIGSHRSDLRKKVPDRANAIRE
jgi:hypothetical protein